MSDIAPFVAAAIRDKTVLDLMEENRKLRDNLEKARAVTITGPDGSPVYAQASFASGAYADNPNLWEVQFTECEKVPLSCWRDLELHVGGVLRVKLGPNDGDYEGYLDEVDEDSENQKMIHFCFGEERGGLWLSFFVQGWPEERWRAYRSRFRLAPDLDEIFQELDSVAEQSSGAVMSVLSVSFFANLVQGAIDGLCEEC